MSHEQPPPPAEHGAPESPKPAEHGGEEQESNVI
jgi:hypothetical protein